MDPLHDVAPAAQVLVVGPDPDAVEFIANTLTRAGIRSNPALSVAGASEILSADPPYSLVVLDADLGALRSIRALADSRRAAIATVVLGPLGATTAAATAAREGGATYWLDRPISEESLIESMRSMMQDITNPDR